MQPSVMTDLLKGLKLHGMAQALGELSAQDSPDLSGFLEPISSRNSGSDC